jgi:hypothetical protein
MPPRNTGGRHALSATPPAGFNCPNYFVFLTISNQCSGIEFSRVTFFMSMPPALLMELRIS